MSDLTPEQVKALADSVEALRTETENQIKSYDTVTQEKITKIETSVSELLAAKNAPVAIDAEELVDQAKELVGEYFAKGDSTFERQGMELYSKAVGDQMSLTVSSEGGNLLPKVIGSLVDGYIRQSAPIRNVARVISQGMNYVQPVKFTGGTADIRGEFDAIHTSAAPQIDTITFTPKEVNAEEKLTVWATEGDAVVDLVNIVLTDIASAIGEKESEIFLTGTIQNPLAEGGSIKNGLLAQTKLVAGVTNRTATLGSMAGAETAAIGEVDFTDFATTRSLLPTRHSGSWMFSKDVELKLMTLKDDMGNYIWSMGNVASGGKSTIFGDSYITSDFFPTVAAAADVPVTIYGDFSKFVIADASPLRWLADPYTSKGFVNYWARRRTSSSIVDFSAFRALYVKAA